MKENVPNGKENSVLLALFDPWIQFYLNPDSPGLFLALLNTIDKWKLFIFNMCNVMFWYTYI